MKKPFFRFALLCLILLLFAGGSLAYLRDKSASDHRNAIAARVESLKREIAALRSERAALEEEVVESQDLEAWVLSSMPIQPLFVDIVRSMGPQSEIVELSIERDAEKPSQLRLSLELNTASDKQLDQTLAAIQRRNYRELNPMLTRIQGNLDYKASLVYEDPDASQWQTPEERSRNRNSVP